MNLNHATSRRAFLATAMKLGLGAGAAALVGCGGSEKPQPTPTAVPPTSTPAPTPTPERARDPDSLRELADKIGFKIGVQGAYAYLQDRNVRQKLPEQFNRLVIGDFQMTNPWFPPLRPTKDTYNFNNPDFTANFARQNQMDIHGQHLVWGTAGKNFTPDWVNNIPSRQEAIDALRDHIKTVMTHFKDVSVWTLVNEPNSHGRPDIWTQKIGEDYPVIAGEAAREANSNVTLILNDFDNHVINQYSNSNLALAQKLASLGLIDGIGFQMHLNGVNPPKKDDVKGNLDRFKRLKDGQFVLLVTEFDVNLQNVPGTTDQRWAREEQVYRDMLEAVLEMGGSGFSVFGNNDKLSWLNDIGFPNSEGTPFDKNFNPKPVYYAMRDVLANYKPS